MNRSHGHARRPLAAAAALFLATGCAGQDGVSTRAPASASPVTTAAAKPSLERSSPSSASSSAAPETAFHEGPLAAGTYVVRPFNPSGWGEETAEDDAIRITLTVPAGWAGVGTSDVMLRAEGNHPPGGAGIIFIRGASMYSNPCHNDGVPDIQVGPTVDDFADALADHPRLDVTAPTDVTLSGYSGKYLDLQVPADPTIQGSSEGASASGCPIYRPWEPGLFAQGPSHRWHLWILDVDGIRVVIQATDYPSTAPQRQSELRAMVESMQITAD